MDNNTFSFIWYRDTDGYVISDFDKSSGSAVFTGSKKIKIIRSKGKERQFYSPLKEKNLHRTFADMGDSDEDILNFVTKYGFLGVPSRFSTPDDYFDSPPGDYFEEVDTIREAHSYLKEAIDSLNKSFLSERRKLERTNKHNVEQGDPVSEKDPVEFTQEAAGALNLWAWRYMQSMRVILQPHNIGKKKLVAWKFEPKTLLSAMWIMTAEEIMSGETKGAKKRKFCMVCNELIPELSLLGRISRTDKEFCSPKCAKRNQRFNAQK